MNLLAIFFIAFLGKNPEHGSHLALSPRAQAQRTEVDLLDYSVNSAYLDSLSHSGALVLHTSRWMNGATCRMTDSLAQVVRSWSFVDSVECTRFSDRPDFQGTFTYPAEGTMPDRCFPLVAISDVGFKNFDQLDCFDHTHFLGGFDLTDNGDSIYAIAGHDAADYTHGTECLSIICGRTLDSGYVAAYPEAYYYLMRSEESWYNSEISTQTESAKEPDNLVAAMELADSLGVNVMSISLGYHTFTGPDSIHNYTYSMMDGRTTRCSRAATIAARKGMLLCIAAGNDGNNINTGKWYHMAAPSDADSILCVGAVDSLGNVAGFSSRGPSADGRVKPDVCEWGQKRPLLTPYGVETRGNGTSFATPRVAGMAAKVWSLHPDWTAQELRTRIIQSANHHTSPDADYGYGIPNWQSLLTIAPTGLQETGVTTAPSSRKLFWNGQLVISRGGQLYDLMGRILK